MTLFFTENSLQIILLATKKVDIPTNHAVHISYDILFFYNAAISDNIRLAIFQFDSRLLLVHTCPTWINIGGGMAVYAGFRTCKTGITCP